MTKPTAGQADPVSKTQLSRRDWLLLPLLGLLTLGLLAGSAELIARHIYYRLPTFGEDCLALPDASKGIQGIPNCVVWEKIPESKPTQYRFDSNGYRNNSNFGPKPPGTYRIVIVGTSVAAGFRVAQDQTMSALLPGSLSQRIGRKVEVYNEGLPSRSTKEISLDLDQAIAQHPDMILWIVSPLDVGYPSMLAHPEPVGALALPPGMKRSWTLIKEVFAKESFISSIATLFSHTSSATMLRDWFYRSPSQYVQSSLAGADYKKGFLEIEPADEWYRELNEFRTGAASIQAQASQAGIPLVVVLVPDRTQAAMISMMRDCPKGYDPYKLGNELRTIVESLGGTYIDILPNFQSVPDPQLGYFALDGHPNAHGHAMIARFLTDKLAGLPQTAAVQPAIKLQTRQ